MDYKNITRAHILKGVRYQCPSEVRGKKTLLSWELLGAGGLRVAQLVLIWRPLSHCPFMFTMAFSASYESKLKMGYPLEMMTTTFGGG